MRSRTTFKLPTSRGGIRENGATRPLGSPSFDFPGRAGLSHRDPRFRSVWPPRDRRRAGDRPGRDVDGTAEIRFLREIPGWQSGATAAPRFGVRAYGRFWGGPASFPFGSPTAQKAGGGSRFTSGHACFN